MPEAIQQLLNFIEAHPWIAITFALIGFFASNLFGSWAKLTKQYATHSQFTGQKWNFQVVTIGNAKYNGFITVGSNNKGLYLAPFIIFRLGYPAIFVPWEHLCLRTEDRLFERSNFLEIDNCKGIKVIISDRLLHRITQASEGNFPLSSHPNTEHSRKDFSNSVEQGNKLSLNEIKVSHKLCLKIFALTFSLGLAVGLFNHGLAQYQAWQSPERYSIYSPGEYVSPQYGNDWPDSFQEFLGLSHPIRVRVEHNNGGLVSETYYSAFGSSRKTNYENGDLVSTGGSILSSPLYLINCVIPLAGSWFSLMFGLAIADHFLTSLKNLNTIRLIKSGFTILIHTAITGFLTFPFLYHLPDMFFFFKELESSLPHG